MDLKCFGAGTATVDYFAGSNKTWLAAHNHLMPFYHSPYYTLHSLLVKEFSTNIPPPTQNFVIHDNAKRL